jgi:hypothetical protein
MASIGPQSIESRRHRCGRMTSNADCRVRQLSGTGAPLSIAQVCVKQTLVIGLDCLVLFQEKRTRPVACIRRGYSIRLRLEHLDYGGPEGLEGVAVLNIWRRTRGVEERHSLG